MTAPVMAAPHRDPIAHVLVGATDGQMIDTVQYLGSTWQRVHVRDCEGEDLGVRWEEVQPLDSTHPRASVSSYYVISALDALAIAQCRAQDRMSTESITSAIRALQDEFGLQVGNNLIEMIALVRSRLRNHQP